MNLKTDADLSTFG